MKAPGAQQARGEPEGAAKHEIEVEGKKAKEMKVEMESVN